MSTIQSLENVTLPDDAWMDSFDKLIGDRELLRLNNVLKKKVNISRNLNSSYENSNFENTFIYTPILRENQDAQELSPILRENQNTLDVPSIFEEKQKLLELSSSLKENLIVSDPSIVLKERQECAEFTPILSKNQPKALFNLVISKQNDEQLNLTKINSNLKQRKGKANIVHIDVPFTSKNGNKIHDQLNCCDNLVSTPIRSVIEPFQCTESPIDIFRFITNHDNLRKTISEKSKRHNQKKDIETNEKNISTSLIVPVIDETIDSPWSVLKKKRRRQVQFKEDDKVIEEMHQSDNNEKCEIQPGKWRKSLYNIRRSSSHKLQSTSLRKSVNIGTENLNGNEEVHTNKSRKQSANGVENYKTQVLRFCQPRKIVAFKDAYTMKYLTECQKIGEGTFGEVFMHSAKILDKKSSCHGTVLKIIPIEGSQLINGEVQKTFEQMLPEIVISDALSCLNNEMDSNFTNGFVNVQKIKCVKGKYPDNLVKLWEKYDERKESENDHPKCFGIKQQFIILELNYGGKDLESWTFRNAEQSYFVLQQIIFTLAVGEKAYQFEHRDLHWGNILIAETTDKSITYKLNGNDIIVPTKGVKMTIIDYTLSRIMYNDICYYCDLSNETELFNAHGDYQFDIYRMMKDILRDKWHEYMPKTNVFWISYVIDKLINGVTYKNTRSSLHNQYMKKLHELNESILEYNSCVDCVKHLFLTI